MSLVNDSCPLSHLRSLYFLIDQLLAALLLKNTNLQGPTFYYICLKTSHGFPNIEPICVLC